MVRTSGPPELAMTHSNRHLLRRCATVLALAAAVTFATDSNAAPSDGADASPAATMGDDSFDLSVKNATAKVGEAGVIVVTVTAGEGYKANKEYPSKVKDLAVAGAAELAATSVSGKVRDNTIVFNVEVTPKAAGRHKVTGEVKFSVCNAESCSIKKVALDATVTGE